MDGGTGTGLLMVILIGKLDTPPVFVAVILYTVAIWVTVGVPDKTPVLVLNDSPDGTEPML